MVDVTSPLYATGVGLVMRGFSHLDRSRPRVEKTNKVEVTTHSANRVGSWFTQVLDKASEFMKDDES